MVRVVFMGSPEFAVPILHKLARSYSIAGVVTQPDRPAGRGRDLRPPPVKVVAQELGLEVMQPRKLQVPEAMDQLRMWAPDLIVVAAFGQILRTAVLTLPTQGCVNVHASLLPRWRGASPIQAAIAAGDAETGVTIMKMDEGVDTGPILSKRSIPILGDDTGESLGERLAVLGTELISDTLPRYLSGGLQPQPQDDAGATYAPMLKAQNGLLDFESGAQVLERRVRAFQPWPGAFLVWNGQRLKVRRAHAEPGQAEAARRLVTHGQPAVGTADGLLILDVVQLEGKKTVEGRAFLMGARGWTE